MQAEVLL